MNEYIITAAALLFIALAAFACRENLKTVKYTVKSDKIKGKVRFILLSDLHGSKYGKNQDELFSLLRKYNPDIILLPGDIIDDRKSKSNDYGFCERIGREYKSYYCIGNHEVRTNNIDNIKKQLRGFGISVPDGCNSYAIINGNRLCFAAVDDIEFFKKAGKPEKWAEALASRLPDSCCFSVLLSHHPNFIPQYSSCGFDLVVSGHAHGGQVRAPFINGLWAPGEGLFPKYAGGKYTLGTTTLIVGRGLSKDTVPRIFNPPEIVVIDAVEK